MSEEENQTIIRKQVDEISKKCEIFSNPMRILIIADILVEKESNWSQLKENIEKLTGSGINPNTLSFHVSKLVEGNYLSKVGTAEQPVYKVDINHSPEINAYIGPALIEKVKEKVLV
jgi:DNA-binding HxlR family transcriptional regulator